MKLENVKKYLRGCGFSEDEVKEIENYILDWDCEEYRVDDFGAFTAVDAKGLLKFAGFHDEYDKDDLDECIRAIEEDDEWDVLWCKDRFIIVDRYW